MLSDSATKQKMILFTAPSGSGKTTIVKHLLAKFSFLGFSVSATSRNKRPHEIDGKDYYFLSAEEFRSKVSKGQFVEWEEVYDDQYYGTLKSEVERLWHAGYYCVFDIDVKGAQSLKAYYGDQCLAVFIKAPSIKELERRLRHRKTESETSLRKRINRAKKELEYEDKFDMVLINDELEFSKQGAEMIVRSFLHQG